MTLDLPTGGRGRLLALALTLLVVPGLWFGVAVPLAGWHAARQDALDRRSVLAEHMAALAASAPELERRAAALTAGTAPDALLAGDSDALAAASLQEHLQAMAQQAGTTLASVEILPAASAGQLRRIGLRVALVGGFAKVMRLLEMIEQARPVLLIDELDLQRHLQVARPTEPDVDARFTVLAFRSAGKAR